MDDFASHSNIAWNGHVGMVEYGGGDKAMVALFYNRAVHNPAKSTDAGSPIFEDQIYVRIHPPGERLNIIDRPAQQSDKRRWPMQWAQFQDNKQQIPEGTPIDLLYPSQPSIAAMLRANGVHTVEVCAELSAGAIENIGMGAQRYVNDAQKYVQVASKGVKASQLMSELTERDSKIRSLEQTVTKLMTEVNQLREQNSQVVGLDQIQQLIASQQMRPVYPQPAKINQTFDSQTAQINATHGTRDVAKAARSNGRQRARIKS